MAAGEFREDLFFRLNVFPIRVPPCATGRQTSRWFASHFLNLLNLPPGGHVSLRDDVVSDLMSRPWLGNIRELRNAIECAAIVARGREIHPEHLPPPAAPATQVGFPWHGSRGDPGRDRPLDRERTSPARPGGDGRLYPLRPLARPCRAALASVTPSSEPGQPRQRRFADRHPSRDAAAEVAEVWDRVTVTLAITRDPPGCRISRTVPTTAWALAAVMARVAQAASSAVPPDDEAGRHGPVPERPACSSDSLAQISSVRLTQPASRGPPKTQSSRKPDLGRRMAWF